MSDAPQGPGWWQASDGKWYPPAAPEAAPEAAPTAEPAKAAPPAGGSNPLDGLAGGDTSVLAAAGLLLASLAVAFGALLTATIVDGRDAWKAMIKTVGLGDLTFGTFGGAGPNLNALFVAIGLIVAVGLVRSASGRYAKLVPLVRFGALGLAAWLALFTALGLVVDLTFLGDDFLAAIGFLAADTGILVALAATALYALSESRSDKKD